MNSATLWESSVSAAIGETHTKSAHDRLRELGQRAIESGSISFKDNYQPSHLQTISEGSEPIWTNVTSGNSNDVQVYDVRIPIRKDRFEKRPLLFTSLNSASDRVSNKESSGYIWALEFVSTNYSNASFKDPSNESTVNLPESDEYYFFRVRIRHDIKALGLSVTDDDGRKDAKSAMKGWALNWMAIGDVADKDLPQ